MDQVIFDTINNSEEKIEEKLDCDILHYYGELRYNYFSYFRSSIEEISSRHERRETLGICLMTPGGQAEAVEKMVEVIRHHYDNVYFIVPRLAMSAGTIFCMSGNKIFMDYSSSLGPIDPQVPDKENKMLIPALGYLDKVNELVEKSRNNQITPAEFALLEKQDLAMLRFYEQSRDLSISLLKQWLVEYKFKNWETHRTTNPGTPVTHQDKINRAREIAELLSDNQTWHSHGRMIGMQTLQNIVKLEIDDYGSDQELQQHIRTYSDTLCDYFYRQGTIINIYNRHVN
jgi:hypothetical protein